MDLALPTRPSIFEKGQHMLSKQAQHLLLILWTTSLLLSGCTKTFPVRTKENISTYQKCKVQQNPQACLKLAEDIALEKWSHNSNHKTQKRINDKITFYLKRSCEQKKWDSCALLGVWLAYMKQSCFFIKPYFERSCKHGFWNACAMLTFQNEHYALTNKTIWFLLNQAKCLPTKAETQKNIIQTYCMAAMKQERREKQGDPVLTCKKRYTMVERHMFGWYFSLWSGGNIIFHLMSKELGRGKYNK